jgi:hypothetical protein
MHLGFLNQKPGPTVILVDTSVPGFLARENQFQIIDSLAKSVNEEGSIFDLWSYDTKPKHLWGPNQIQAVDMIDAVENNDLKFSPGGVRIQPRADLMLSAFQASPAASQQRGRVYLLTDGYIGNPVVKEKLTAALKSFAKQSGWRVVVLGIPLQNQPAWATSIAAALPGRVDLVDQHSAVSLLAQNRDE